MSQALDKTGALVGLVLGVSLVLFAFGLNFYHAKSGQFGFALAIASVMSSPFIAIIFYTIYLLSTTRKRNPIYTCKFDSR